jgi:UDP-2-acetamido-3-amino-2,3-dideoxy-glucuronate N-acetyltransferase
MTNAMIVPGNFRIAPSASIGTGVLFVDHPTDVTTIREGVKIGVGAIIGAGIELGVGCQIEAGSVVLQSVPAHARVLGNPAQIVGYTPAGDIASPPVHGAAVASEPNYAIGVGGCAIQEMPRFSDLRGDLSVGEFATDLPFLPTRYFVVFDVPSRELRGGHAHKECAEFLICVAGSCRVLVDDGHNRAEVDLNSPSKGLHMPAGIWGSQFAFTKDAVLLVFASHNYEPEDYIRTYDEFRTFIAGRA